MTEILASPEQSAAIRERVHAALTAHGVEPSLVSADGWRVDVGGPDGRSELVCEVRVPLTRDEVFAIATAVRSAQTQL